jgi:hypothetical protein
MISGKAKIRLTIIIGAIPSLMAIKTAVELIAGPKDLVDHFIELGFADYMKYLGSFIILIVALFWIPKTHKIALLLLTGYFGGALAADLSHHSPCYIIIVILSLFWIAAYLRDKSTFVVSSEPRARN